MVKFRAMLSAVYTGGGCVHWVTSELCFQQCILEACMHLVFEYYVVSSVYCGAYVHLEVENYAEINTKKYHVFAPMGRF